MPFYNPSLLGLGVGLYPRRYITNNISSKFVTEERQDGETNDEDKKYPDHCPKELFDKG